MESSKAVDAAGAAQMKALRVCVCLILLVVCCLSSYTQTDPTAAAKQLFEQERWPEIILLLGRAPHNTPDLNFYYGLALAHEQRWQEAAKALSAGQQIAPHDKRFPIELAGVAFKQKKYAEAKRDLHRALSLDAKD